MMSSIDHLHVEAEILTVKEHLDMLCSQALATYLQAGHPSFPVVTADSGPRNKKHTLQSRFNARVGRHIGQDGRMADTESAHRDIHTAAVAESIASRDMNRVLGAPAPPVHEEERQLPRKTRRTLSQLRSGHCYSLNDYKHRIGQSDSNICPCCRQEEHTVQHIFECPVHPTPLQPEDLWSRPVTAAEFLRTLPFFELPEEPEPPPEPPPSNLSDFR